MESLETCLDLKTVSRHIFTPPIFTPPRGGVMRFLSLFLCQQHYKKTAGPICIKFSGKVWSDRGTTRLNFWSVRVNGSAGQRSICLLSPAIARRTGINKSVSFARWQLGAGFVVPRTTACYCLGLCLATQCLGLGLGLSLEKHGSVLQYFSCQLRAHCLM